MPHDTPPLVGRADVLQEVVRRARTGVGTVLTGPARSGGQRLLAEASAALRKAGRPVVRLTPPATPPTGSGRGLLALLDPATARRIQASDPAPRSAELLAALEALALPVLLVDDAPALDEESLTALAHLARTGTAVVADSTGEAVPEPLAALEAEGRLVVVALPPLTEAEVAELAEHLLLDPVDTELRHALLDVTGGLPGRLAEVVHDGVGNRSIVHTDGIWHLAGPLPSPRSLRTRVRGAFTDLPPDQRGWVAAVATAGTIAGDLGDRIAAATAREATERAGWTERDADGATRMSSVAARAAVTDSLAVRARVAILRRLLQAQSIARQPRTDAERVAAAVWRLELGDPVEPAEALSLAALEHVRTDDRDALLRAALQGGGPAATAALADHLRRTRRPGEALQAIHAALPGATSPADRVLLVRVEAMTTGVVERRSGEALAALDEYLREYGPATDLLAVRSALLLLEGRVQESADTAAAVLADDGRSAFAETFARLQATFGLRELGRTEAAIAAARRFADGDAGRAFPDGEALGRWLPHETEVAVAVRLDPAESALERLHARATAERRTSHRPLYAYTLGTIRLHRGEAAEAVRLLREADSGSGSWRDGWRPRILAELAGAQAIAGALDDATATLARLRALRSPPVQHGRAGIAGSRIAAARGDREHAIALALEVADRGREHGLLLDQADGLVVAMLHGDGSAAERLLALGPEPSGAARDAQRAVARAVLDGDPEGLLAGATALWDRGLRLQAVGALLLSAADHPETARRLAAWLARIPTLHLSPRTRGHGAALTTREREVALLAASDRPDRIIAAELGITLRTAQTHLARVYAKLGVHRRADLRSVLERE